jgi:TrmH family RNA methyltransferase
LSLLPLEGVRLVEDALRRDIKPEAVLLREGESWELNTPVANLGSQVPVFTVEQKLFDKTAFTDSPQGIIAIVPRPAYSIKDIFSAEPALLLIVDRLQDPGNLGTMIRSAAAAGASGTVLLPGTVDAANPKALRAAMGTYFSFPVVEAPFDSILTGIRERGVRLVATSADADLPYDNFDWTVPTAVLIGNEATGVSAEAAQAADAVVSVPMSSDVESLNAAVAMSVIFFEAARQRRTGLVQM